MKPIGQLTKEITMSYEQKDNEGSLFRNDKEGNPKRPDFKGTIRIAGIDYWLSGWNNAPRDGKKGYMALKAQPKEGQENKENTDVDFDSLPF